MSPAPAPGWGASGDFTAVLRLIDRLEDRTADLTAVWPEVGRWYADRQRTLFTTSSSWPPRKASTIATLHRHGLGGGPVLVRTGALRAAATAAAPLRSASRYAAFGVDTGPVGQRARWLAKGRRSMPRRNPVPALSAAEKARVARVIADRILRGLV